MTTKHADLAERLHADPDRGLFGVLAEEEDLDQRALWRLGSWAVSAIGALVLAILVSQSSGQDQQGQMVSADLARQAQQIQRLTKEAQTELSRLGAAIETLNSDRDRLFTRVTMMEQNLESVTGSIARGAAAFPPHLPVVAAQPAHPVPKSAARASSPAPGPAPDSDKTVAEAARPASPAPEPVPVPASRPDIEAGAPKPAETPAPAAAEAAPPAPPSTPSRPEVVISRAMLGPPDPAAGRLIDPAAATTPAAATASPTDPHLASRASLVAAPRPLAPPAVVSTTQEPEPAAAAPKLPSVPVPRTEFGIDLGGANSLDNLRVMWSRLIKTHKTLSALTPVVTVKERNTGTQLRLIAGPITDAATAAKLCAGLTAADQFCETAMYDGQRLSTKRATPAPPPAPPQQPATATKKRTNARFSPEPEPEHVPQPPQNPPTPPPHSSLPSSSLSSLLGLR